MIGNTGGREVRFLYLADRAVCFRTTDAEGDGPGEAPGFCGRCATTHCTTSRDLMVGEVSCRLCAVGLAVRPARTPLAMTKTSATSWMATTAARPTTPNSAWEHRGDDREVEPDVLKHDGPRPASVLEGFGEGLVGRCP